MVFFGTLDVNNNIGFQGVSRLASFKRDGILTRNVGYYGHSSKNLPITNPDKIPSRFLRKEIGTDIFIVGFDDQEEWENKLIESIISNFFMAILNNKLNVKINGELINKESLPGIIEKHFKNEDFGYQFYKAVADEESEDKYIFKEENFKGMGEIELHILKDPKFKKKVAVVRSNGMRIVNYDRFQGAAPFSGVLLIKGEELNTFLRKCENPSHDNFEAMRYKNDPPKAKKLLSDLRKWSGQKIKDVFLSTIGEKIEVKGVERYLNNLLPSHGEIRKSETLKKEVKKAKVKTKRSSKDPVSHNSNKEKKKKISFS